MYRLAISSYSHAPSLRLALFVASLAKGHASFAGNPNKARDGTLDVLRAKALAHPTLACDLCHVYGQDYRCLGYRIPDSCLAPDCFGSLRPHMRAAAAEACARRSWPPACAQPDVRAAMSYL